MKNLDFGTAAGIALVIVAVSVLVLALRSHAITIDTGFSAGSATMHVQAVTGAERKNAPVK